MKTVLSALVRQKGHARGAMGLAAKLQADNETLRARIAKLEAALAPFADGLTWFESRMSSRELHSIDVNTHMIGCEITVADLRRARSLLASPQRSGDRPGSPPYGGLREPINRPVEEEGA